MLVSDSDEAALQSNLRPYVSGQALKRSRRQREICIRCWLSDLFPL
jgi:hypothetical protein